MTSEKLDDIIRNQFDKTLDGTNFESLGSLYKGKVRDNYIKKDVRIIIATDRLSAFDRVITTIPFKGQMLNQVSSFWFEKTKNLVKNHIIDIPDPNVSIVHQCEMIPVEIKGLYEQMVHKAENLEGEIQALVALAFERGKHKNG